MIATVNNTIQVVFNRFQNIALVLDISAHDVVDGGAVRVGDLGDAVEPLDDVGEGEELSVGDRIEREQN